MARGWESKSVESQIESAESRKTDGREQVSSAEIARAAERHSLELSLTRVMHDLDTARNPRYRVMLEASRDHLVKKIADLG